MSFLQSPLAGNRDKAGKLDEQEALPNEEINEEKLRTSSVSWPVHPALDEIIQELEDKLHLKENNVSGLFAALSRKSGSIKVGKSVGSIKIITSFELAECRREKENGTASDLKGMKVPKPIRDINRELKWSFKT